METKQLTSQKRQLDDNEERSKKFKAVHMTFNKQSIIYSDPNDKNKYPYNLLNKMIKEQDDIQNKKEKFEKIFKSINNRILSLITERNKYQQETILSQQTKLHLYRVCKNLYNNIEDMNKYIINIQNEKNKITKELTALRIHYTEMCKKIEDDNNSITNFLQLL